MFLHKRGSFPSQTGLIVGLTLHISSKKGLCSHKENAELESLYPTSNVSLLYKETPTLKTNTCRNILPQEQAESINRSPTNSSTDSPTRLTLDSSSLLLRPVSAAIVNESRPTILADTLESSNMVRREASNISYAYRPTHIDSGSQHPTFFQPSPSFNNHNKSSFASNTNKDTHQGPNSIEGIKMPYDLSGMFTMNPEAPVFVPRQGGQLDPGGQAVEGDQRGMLPLCWRTVWGPI